MITEQLLINCHISLYNGKQIFEVRVQQMGVVVSTNDLWINIPDLSKNEKTPNMGIFQEAWKQTSCWEGLFTPFEHEEF